MYEYKCNVVRVIDGDTIVVDIDLGFEMWLKNQHVRVYGIDAPEVRTRDLVEKEAGLKATQFVNAYLLEGDITFISENFNGKYGRLMGDFKAPFMSMTLKEALLENGLAEVYE